MRSTNNDRKSFATASKCLLCHKDTTMLFGHTAMNGQFLHCPNRNKLLTSLMATQDTWLGRNESLHLTHKSA